MTKAEAERLVREETVLNHLKARYGENHQKFVVVVGRFEAPRKSGVDIKDDDSWTSVALEKSTFEADTMGDGLMKAMGYAIDAVSIGDYGHLHQARNQEERGIWLWDSD